MELIRLLSPVSQLYDSPWNVYKCFGTLPTIQRDSLVARLKQFFDEDDAVRPIPGELLECTVDLISIQAGTNTLSGVALLASLTINTWELNSD